MLDSAWLFPLVAVLLVAAAYARAPWLGLVYDDDIIIRANPYITSVRYIPTYFTEHVWTDLMLARNNYYRPVFLLWLLAGYKMFGTNPLGWHLRSLLMHLGSVVMLYQLALRITRSKLGALSAALIFGLHPVQVENVVWSSAVTELLCTFLSLASLLCYLRSLESASRRLLLLSSSVFLFALAILAKETAIVIPVVIFLHEWLGRPAVAAPHPVSAGAPKSIQARKRAFLGALRESLPFGAVVIAYLAARIAVLGGIGQITASISTQVWLQTIPYTLQVYLTHLIWPAGLSAFYDYGYVNEFTFRAVLFPVALLACLGAALIFVLRKTPGGQLAAVWMTLAILPVLDLPVFPRGEFLHDRYLYHPLIGLSLLVGLGIAGLERRLPVRESRTGLYAGLCTGCAVLALVLGVVTFRQTGYWKDNFALYSRGVEVAPRSGFANTDLGSVYLNRGQVDQAMVLFQRSLEYTPNLYLTHYDMGIAYYQTGRFADAEAAFKRAVSIMPQFADGDFFLGMTYFNDRRVPEAMDCIRKAIALKPNNVDYHFALAIMLRQSGDVAGARAEFQEVLKRDPSHRPTLSQLHSLDIGAPSGALP